MVLNLLHLSSACSDHCIFQSARKKRLVMYMLDLYRATQVRFPGWPAAAPSSAFYTRRAWGAAISCLLETEYSAALGWMRHYSMGFEPWMYPLAGAGSCLCQFTSQDRTCAGCPNTDSLSFLPAAASHCSHLISPFWAAVISCISII